MIYNIPTLLIPVNIQVKTWEAFDFNYSPISLIKIIYVLCGNESTILIENVFSLTSECVTKRSHSFIIVTSPSVKTVKVQILKTHDNTFFVPLNFIVYLIFLLTRSPHSH